MKRRTILLIAATLVSFLVSRLPASLAADAPKCPNAAVTYWTAFAAMPKLTEAQANKLRDSMKTVSPPVPADVRPLAAKFDLALQELQRAHEIACCDWQLDYQAGPYLRLEHLQHARELGRAALVRARLRFAAGETDAAIDDVLATMKMARDCGGSPVLISLLVDVAVEKDAIEVLAANLPRLTPDQLDALSKSLAQLPATASLADCVRQESHMFGGWLQRRVAAEVAKLNDPQAGWKIIKALQKDGVAAEWALKILDEGDPADAAPAAGEAEFKRRRDLVRSMTVAEVQQAIKVLQADYETTAKIAALPAAEQAERWAKLEAELGASRELAKREDLLRIFSSSFLPSTRVAAMSEERIRVLRGLLVLAVQIQRHGPDALKNAPPIGQGKIAYQKGENGFELTVNCAVPEKTVTLRVGPDVQAKSP